MLSVCKALSVLGTSEDSEWERHWSQTAEISNSDALLAGFRSTHVDTRKNTLISKQERIHWFQNMLHLCWVISNNYIPSPTPTLIIPLLWVYTNNMCVFYFIILLLFSTTLEMSVFKTYIYIYSLDYSDFSIFPEKPWEKLRDIYIRVGSFKHLTQKKQNTIQWWKNL